MLDEPSTGLDPIVRRDILAAIIRDDRRGGADGAVLVAPADEVERMADWVAMIDRGRIVLCGPLDEMKAAHRRLTLRFDEPRSQPPRLAGSLHGEGFGRDWTTRLPGRRARPSPARQPASGRRIVDDQSLRSTRSSWPGSARESPCLVEG